MKLMHHNIKTVREKFSLQLSQVYKKNTVTKKNQKVTVPRTTVRFRPHVCLRQIFLLYWLESYF